MTGTDAEVRAFLQKELERLHEADAHVALGVAAGATPDEIRAAFLRATKAFHPNRFARRERDVVKLSNEVFLCFKDAYRQLTDRDKTDRDKTDRDKTDRDKTDNDRGTGANDAPVRAGSLLGQAVDSNATAVPSRRRPISTNPLPAPPPRDQPAPPARERHRPSQQAMRTNPFPAPPPPAPPPPAARPGTRTQPITALVPPRPARASSPTPVPVASTIATSPGGWGEAGNSVRLLERGEWQEAARELEKLVAAHPEDRRIAARLHYARGRHHEKQGNLVDAHIEYRRAIEADPGFVDAQRAVASLVGR